MEKQHSEVVLFGTWSSAYTKRVELALKLKGISYEYIEEDLSNKSELLLNYNPIHKKVPVLVHRGKPISESLVILEYIDDCWKHAPKLLPDDPYERAKVRFWAGYYENKVLPSSVNIMSTTGKERANAIEEFNELLGVFEECCMKKDLASTFSGRSGDLGLLDITVGPNACSFRAFEEAIDTTICLEKYPTFLSWVNSLSDCPLMKDILPPHDKLVSRIIDASLFSRLQRLDSEDYEPTNLKD